MTERLDSAERLGPSPLVKGTLYFLLGLTSELSLAYGTLPKNLGVPMSDPIALRSLTGTLASLAEARGDAAAGSYWRYRQAQLNYYFPSLLLLNT